MSDLPSVDVGPRLDRLRQAMSSIPADWLLVTSPVNIRWLSGFAGSNATVFVSEDRMALFTDPRYDERAATELAAVGCDARVAVIQGPIDDAVRALVGGDTVAGEAAHLTWARRDRIQADWLDGAELVATDGLIEGLRARKDAAEIARIERAASQVDRALAEVTPMLDSGPTERDVARAIEAAIRTAGADDIGFDAIVASGPNAAVPHHSPGDRRIVDGDLVIMDIGGMVDGYRSDMTRTFAVGAATEAQQRHYDVVAAAQQAGFDAMVDGAATSAVDAAARAVIEEAGWADAFPHGTGHGIGLDIHESPAVSRTAEDTYEVGTVATVEPGVYLRGVGGVRVEDTCVVTAEGPRRLTGFPKGLAVR